MLTQARSRGRGVQCTTSNLPKGPLFGTKLAKNVFVCVCGLRPKGPIFATKWPKNGVL